MTILKDLSIGEADHSKLAKLIATQGALLKHAMRSESSSLVKKIYTCIMETQYKFVGTFNKLLKRRGEDHFNFMKITFFCFIIVLLFLFTKDKINVGFL